MKRCKRRKLKLGEVLKEKASKIVTSAQDDIKWKEEVLIMILKDKDIVKMLNKFSYNSLLESFTVAYMSKVISKEGKCLSLLHHDPSLYQEKIYDILVRSKRIKKLKDILKFVSKNKEKIEKLLSDNEKFNKMINNLINLILYDKKKAKFLLSLDLDETEAITYSRALIEFDVYSPLKEIWKCKKLHYEDKKLVSNYLIGLYIIYSSYKSLKNICRILKDFYKKEKLKNELEEVKSIEEKLTEIYPLIKVLGNEGIKYIKKLDRDRIIYKTKELRRLVLKIDKELIEAEERLIYIWNK